MLSLKVIPSRGMFIKVTHVKSGDTFLIGVADSNVKQTQILLDGDKENFHYLLVRPDRKTVPELKE